VCNKKGGAVWFFEMTKHERIISMFEIGSRRGRDAKWKEGGTGLKAEMGKEGSCSRGRLGRATAAAADGGCGTNQPNTEIWTENFEPWQ